MIWFSAESALMSTSPSACRADQHADDEKHRDVGNLDLLRQQAGDGADGQNEPAGQQRVLGNFDRGRRFQFFSRSPLAIMAAKTIMPNMDEIVTRGRSL